MATQYLEFLGCGLDRVEIDFHTNVVTLRLPQWHCTDMRGAIRYALGLNPDVRRVVTVAGDTQDTVCGQRESARGGTGDQLNRASRGLR